MRKSSDVEKESKYDQFPYEGSKLYAAWPGRWQTDLFEIDDIEAYGKANNVEKYKYEVLC